jgi:hypothetical protein
VSLLEVRLARKTELRLVSFSHFQLRKPATSDALPRPADGFGHHLSACLNFHPVTGKGPCGKCAFRGSCASHAAIGRRAILEIVPCQPTRCAAPDSGRSFGRGNATQGHAAPFLDPR